MNYDFSDGPIVYYIYVNTYLMFETTQKDDYLLNF